MSSRHELRVLAGRRPTASLLLVLFLAGVAGFAAGCGSDDNPVELEDPGPAFAPTPGAVADLPPDVDPSELTVYAGADTGPVDASGGFEVSASRTRPQLMVLADAAGRAVHLSVFGGDEGDSIVFSSRETAHALVFLHPLFITATGEDWDRARTIASTRSGFSDLVAALATSIAAGNRPGDADPAVAAALAQVYTEFAAYLWDNFRYWKGADKESELGPTGGFEISDLAVAADSTEITLRVRNEYRRWVALYASGRDAAGYRPAEFVELVPSPRITFFAAVLDGMGRSEAYSASHTVDVDGCDRLRISGYGLGFGQLAEGEWDRAAEAMFCPFVFDYALPLLEAVSGVGGLGVDGDPADDPLMTLVTTTLERGGAALADDLEAAIRLQDPDELVPTILQNTVATFIGDPEAFTEALVEQVRTVRGDTAVAAVPLAILDELAANLTLVDAAIAQSDGMCTLGSTLALPAATHLSVDLGDTTSHTHLLRGRVNDATNGYGISHVVVSVFDLDGVPVTSTEGTSVGYFSLAVPPGDLIVRFTRRGYRGYDQLITIYSDDAADYWMDAVDLVPAFESTGSLEGIVVDAVNGQQVYGATVELLPGFNRLATDVLRSTTSATRGDSNGVYTFDGVIPGCYTVRSLYSGYLPTYTYVTVLPQYRAAVPQLLIAPEGSSVIRIVLSWGVNPSDLDSHLLVPEGEGPAFDVRWNHRGEFYSWPYADLDIDDTTSYGPETITVAQPQSGTYSYAVYHWAGSGSIATSHARVMVYGSQGLIREWRPPSSGAGRWWYVFDMDATTERLYSVNSLQDTPPVGIAPSKAGERKPAP
jgi:hypothetical protein